MARMHPRKIVFEKSQAERRVFERLARALPDAYDVLHHVSWVQRRGHGGAKDGEADFVIVHPERGVLVLEVKGGLVRYESESGLWATQPGGRGEPALIADPFEQATEAMHQLRRWLQQLPGWRREWGPFGHAVAFPDGVLHGSPLPHVRPELVIDADDLLTDERALRKVTSSFDFWADGRRLDRVGADRVVSALAHDLEIRQPLGLVVEEAEREILKLSEQQLGILRTLAGARRVAVAGPAGSGKTVLAAEKARRLANDGFQTLLTCFNRPLADYLRQSLAGSKGLEVLSFHQLCRKLAMEASLPLPPGPSWTQAEWDRVASLLEPAADRLGPRYDALVVDEGQDFDDDWWLPLLTLLHEPDHGVLYVFYDCNQAIYGRARGLPPGLLPVALFENWRNTRPVFETVLRYYKGEQIVSRGPDGPKVEWRQVLPRNMRRDLGQVLHRIIREGGLASGEVVVLTPTAVERSAVVGRCGAFNLTEERQGPDDVKLSTIHRFKGLEAKAVVVCEVTQRNGPQFEQLMYVACSRARSLLVVLEAWTGVEEVTERSRSSCPSTNPTSTSKASRPGLTGGG